ncbi:hypothetical protein CVT24_007681 [Panaeolus cyanescens]|uniref:Gas1-like protein n=1 Tax=Panaeolus cyanescens TaxID=181874 RepID=A0A409VRH6_9AGAR|nr:hypothetical protein CVT24_007681 [Panaeolus cyanescens]
MFGKIFTATSLVLALAAQAYGHAAIAPVLGLNRAPVRNDVKRPSNNNPCGNGVNIANGINGNSFVTVQNGAITVTSTNFNGGRDGSRQVTARLNASGAGNNFNTALTVTRNGNGNPNNVGSEQVTVAIPANTRCTGGANRNRCLVQFRTSAGFGNCVVVQQGAANAQAGNGNGNNRNRNRGLIAGTRAARAALADIEARGVEATKAVRRSLSSWLWGSESSN